MALTRNDMNNLVLLKGNLTKDAEFRQTPNGNKVARFRLAINKRWKDSASGEVKNSVTFVDVDVWGNYAEYIRDYQKGDYVQVAGELASESWEKDGQKKYRTYVNAKTVENFNRRADDAESEDSMVAA